MKKILLLILVCFLILKTEIFAHGQGVHQYMVRQGYEILKTYYGEDIPILHDHVGNNEEGDIVFDPGNLLVIGAWREDNEDVVYWNFGQPGGWQVTNTHFYEPDGGENWTFDIWEGPYQNAYQKSLKYIYGGYELRVPYPGASIIECYDAPSNIFDYYKNGSIYYKGYIDMGTGSFTTRGYWTTSPQWLRDRVVWEILGRVCHLIGDMTVPAHVHGDPHWPDLDSYEEWMNYSGRYGNYTAGTALTQGNIIDLRNYPNPLKYLFYTTAQITDYFPSDDYSGDNNPCPLDDFSNYLGLDEFISNMNNELGGPPSAVTESIIAHYTFNYGLRMIASFMNWCASELGLIPRIIVKNNFEYGTIKVGFNSQPFQQDSPFPFYTMTGKTINIEAQNQPYQGVDRVWNINGVPSSISNWSKGIGQNALIVGWNPDLSFVASLNDNNTSYIANLRKNYKIDVDHQTEFDGLQADQSITYIVEQNSDQISTLTQKTLNGRTYNFAGWADGNGENPRTITPTDNTTYTALYKIPTKSNELNAYANNSQRKFIQTKIITNAYGIVNILHNVYESMGHVWYETSTNAGITWNLMNNSRPLDQNGGKCPSIDFENGHSPNGGTNNDQKQVVITWQEKVNNLGALKLAVFYWYDQQSFFIKGYEGFVIDPYEYDYFLKPYAENTNPVISWAKNNGHNIIIIWQGKYSGIFNPVEDGLVYKYGSLGTYAVSWETALPQHIYKDGFFTDINSINPTVSNNKFGYEYSNRWYLAWQQNKDASSSKIYYCYIDMLAPPSLSISDINDITSFSPYNKNINPSVLALQNGEARICWIGERQQGHELPPTEGSEKTVVFTDPDNTGRFWTFGSNINSVSINKCNDRYTLAWASNDDTPIKYTDSGTLRDVYTLGIKGKDVQLSIGSEPTTMHALAFNTQNLPYYMRTEKLYSSQPPIRFDERREGGVSEEMAQVYFNIGDVVVDQEQVGFVEIPDTVSINSLQTANEYLVSEPFTLNDNSEFFYSVQYGITDSLLAANMLNGNKNLSFKVELLDAQTNEILGVFDEVTYNEGNLEPYEKIDYQVITDGIGERLVKLRLVIGSNFTPDYSVSEKYDEENVLAKKSYKQISFQGSLGVTEYSLAQNYPNPFNPSTTINYQIKEDGLVTLKIYDILGAEVKTLVNEEKTKGRYTHNFNGSDLASGVYIYQLRVNDFVSSKKLMLLK